MSADNGDIEEAFPNQTLGGYTKTLASYEKTLKDLTAGASYTKSDNPDGTPGMVIYGNGETLTPDEHSLLENGAEATARKRFGLS